ncbi:MAG: elongation factor P [Candidatus Taylorbacteria bacterium]
MLEYNEVKERKYIIFEKEPYEVLTSHVFRKQQRKPVNATKLRNLLTGRIVEHSYHVSEKIEEADLSTKVIKYLYSNRGEFWFCEKEDPSKRFKLEEAMLGSQVKFLKPNSVVDALIFEEKIIGVKLPIKVELKVIEAADAVKGNTVQGGTKAVKLETGADIQVPMFVNQGDVIRVNTESGEYVERV